MKPMESNSYLPTDIVVLEAKRTPMGSFNGVFAGVPATQLGAVTIDAVTEHVNTDEINEVIMGCVLPAGLGQAPARQAMLKAGLPTHVGATTINKVCGSGMKAVMLGSDIIRAGSAHMVVVGGMENMSSAPYMLSKGRSGYRMGHGQVLDHMMFDGLENAYDGKAMGCFAQDTADKEGMTREDMDEFALSSLSKAQFACGSKAFDAELTPVTVPTKKGQHIVSDDENPQNAKPEKIPLLRAAFKTNGTITAANSSSISDGAAALLLANREKSHALGLKPIARIIGYSTHSIAPEDFTIAPVGAMEKLLARVNWTVDDVDLFEINEAFAMVTMLAIKSLKLSPEKVNVNGGACALGHPIGASGARIIVTLIHALRARGLQRGIAALCIGGGEATAIAIEIEGAN